MPSMSHLYAGGKFILAPMVRVGTLPMRMLALEYGADLVYTEEMIDKAIIGCERVVNDSVGTVDYVKKGRVIWRTDPAEKNRLIFQLGSANPQDALQAALTVAQDVAGIDLNCGCPVHFSTHAGMGSALLKTPDLLVQILETLVQHSGKPVTCKIRILPTLEETLALVKRLAATGIQAIGVHCRQVKDRPRDPAHWNVLQPIAESVSIPILANGDFFTRKEGLSMLQETKVASILVARGAMWNPSMFRKEGPLPIRDVMRAYLAMAMRYDNNPSNTKYCLLSMEADSAQQRKLVQELRSYRDHRSFCKLLEMEYVESIGGADGGRKRKDLDSDTDDEEVNMWNKMAGR